MDVDHIPNAINGENAYLELTEDQDFVNVEVGTLETALQIADRLKYPITLNRDRMMHRDNNIQVCQ